MTTIICRGCPVREGAGYRRRLKPPLGYLSL